jgi:hypothetical protein
MPKYRERGLQIAEALRDLPGVKVVPDPPQTTMMHLLLHREPKSLQAAVTRLAQKTGIWTFGYFKADSPEVQRVELDVGDATLELSPEEVRGAVEDCSGTETWRLPLCVRDGHGRPPTGPQSMGLADDPQDLAAWGGRSGRR